MGCFTNSLATYLMYCRPWSMKGLNDSPITVFATVSDLAFFPRSRSTSIFGMATVNTLDRNSVFCINSGMPNRTQQSRKIAPHSNPIQMADNSETQSFVADDAGNRTFGRTRKTLGHDWAILTA